VIVWQLLTEPAATFHELRAVYYASRTGKDKRPATTSGSSKHSASPSPSPRQPDRQA